MSGPSLGNYSTVDKLKDRSHSLSGWPSVTDSDVTKYVIPSTCFLFNYRYSLTDGKSTGQGTPSSSGKMSRRRRSFTSDCRNCEAGMPFLIKSNS